MARVLVVDDEESVRGAFAALLRHYDHVVDTAADGQAALEAVAERAFDVIVTDVIMPRMDGVELLDRLAEAAPTAKVILITGEPTLQSATAALHARAFDYLAKPVGREALCRCVAQAAHAKALEDENRLYREHLEALVEERTHSLRASEERYRSVFQAASAAIAVADIHGRWLAANDRTCEMLGYSREELLTRSNADVRHPEDAAAMRETFGALLAGRENSARLEKRYIRKDGQVVWVDLSIGTLRDADGAVVALTGVGTDVTDRHRAERALASLSHQLVAAQETERRRVARELHDEIGQALTALKLELQVLEQRLGDESVRAAIERTETAIRQVRELSRDLRPSVLDDLGLGPALRWLVGRLGPSAGLNVNVSDDCAARLPDAVEIACFRIAQEAVTNVVRHAQARNVAIELWCADGSAHVTIRDDGRGFVVDAALDQAARGASLGLMCMRERATLLGGEVTVESGPDVGTEVHAWVPLGEERP